MTNCVMTAAVIGAGMLISASQGASAAGFTIEGDLDAMTLKADQTPSKDIIAEIAERFSLGIQNAAGGTAAISGRFSGDLNHILKAILPQHSYAIAYRDGRPSRITFIAGGGRAATAATAVMMGQEGNSGEGMLNAFPEGVSGGAIGEDSVSTNSDPGTAMSEEAGTTGDALPSGPDAVQPMSGAEDVDASQAAATAEAAPPSPIGWDPDAPIEADLDDAAGSEASESVASPAPAPQGPADMMETAPQPVAGPAPSLENPASMAETVPEAPGAPPPSPSVPEATPSPTAEPDQAHSPSAAPG